MYKKYFYELKIELKDFHLELNELKLEKSEYDYILTKAKDAVHHKLLDFFLNELAKDAVKKDFLHLIKSKKDPESIFGFLENKIENFETKLILKEKEIEKELVSLLLD